MLPLPRPACGRETKLQPDPCQWPKSGIVKSCLDEQHKSSARTSTSSLHQQTSTCFQQAEDDYPSVSVQFPGSQRLACVPNKDNSDEGVAVKTVTNTRSIAHTAVQTVSEVAVQTDVVELTSCAATHDSSAGRNTHDPSVGQNTHDSSLGQNNHDPSVGQNTHDPSVRQNSHDLSAGQNSHDPSVVQNSHDPSVGQNTHEPSAGQNTLVRVSASPQTDGVFSKVTSGEVCEEQMDCCTKGSKVVPLETVETSAEQPTEKVRHCY